MVDTPDNAGPIDSLDNSTILRRLIEGGSEELTNLFIQLREPLKAMIYSRLDPRLHARVDPSDIVQETYLRAVKNLKKYLSAPTLHPVVWLRLIGKHLVAETHRRHFRAKRSPAQEEMSLAFESGNLIEKLTDSVTSVQNTLARKELADKIRQMFLELHQYDREVLEMRHTDGMTLLEIAETLSITADAAKKRYHRALVRFRELASHLM